MSDVTTVYVNDDAPPQSMLMMMRHHKPPHATTKKGPNGLYITTPLHVHIL
jgi:hypothetical protein